MIIGVCGFTSTGSSAVSDFLKEFEDNQVLDKREFIYTYCPDGLEDLDYHLNAGSVKYNSSSVAIPRFRQVMKFFLRPAIKGNVNKYLDEFLNNIIQVSWHGYGGTDIVLYKNKLVVKYMSGFMRKILFRFFAKFNLYPNIFPSRLMEYSANPENFDESARIFIDNILKDFGADASKNIVLDQPFTGNNPRKSFKFFRNPKAIVVDRDPRDNYLFTKMFLKNVCRQIPTNDVESFVQYYKNMRDNMPYKNDDPDILRVNFEELIYDYDNSTNKIVGFLGLGEHSRPRSVFEPNLSINNTQLFLKYPEFKEDIEYIEKTLSEYLFDFDKYEGIKPNKGKMFYGKSPLNK